MQPWLTGIITRSKTADLSPSDWSTGQYGLGTFSTSSFPASIVLSPCVHPATTQSCQNSQVITLVVLSG